MDDENDIIHEALNESRDERAAEGYIDDTQVVVHKQYEHTPKNEQYWHVHVTTIDKNLNGSTAGKTFTTGSLDERESRADTYFANLMKKYPSLTEVEVKNVA